MISKGSVLVTGAKEEGKGTKPSIGSRNLALFPVTLGFKDCGLKARNLMLLQDKGAIQKMDDVEKEKKIFV